MKSHHTVFLTVACAQSHAHDERGATILMPTSMVDSMNPAVALALAARQGATQPAKGPSPASKTPNDGAPSP